MNARDPILIIEDEPTDVELLKSALHWGHILNPIQMVGTGREAIELLKGTGQSADRAVTPKPGAMILDLYLPGMSGFELLQWIQEHPEFKIVPTIVFTSSTREKDVGQAYALGADSYLVKPLTFDELVMQVKHTFEFWLAHAPPPVPPLPRTTSIPAVSARSSAPVFTARAGEK